jgi:hypothetical protein
MMSDPRPLEPPQTDALRAQLEAWLNQQNQALLEGVMATWQESLNRFHPDDALLARLREMASEVTVIAPPADLDLAPALDLLEGAPSQGDLLKRLLEALSPMVERSALFILKQGLASLHAHRGFEGGTPLKPGAVVPPAELEALIQGSVRSIRHKGPGYSALIGPLSTFEASDIAIYPLHHKRKTVALVMVDSGLLPKLNHPEQTRALVLVASAMLAYLAAVKDEEAAIQTRVESQPSAPTQSLPEPIEAAPPAADLEPKTRAGAERLARVLAGDVELYFPAKVAQARSQGNLYGLLREELDRSRATFIDRFGEGVEIRHRIFTNAVIHLLCDGDTNKLGAAPWA